MANPTTLTGDPSPSLIIAGNLSPAKAAEVRDNALALLAAAEAGKTTVRIDLDGAVMRPVSLQLLVAARRSAASRGLALEFGPAATDVLGRLETMQPVGRSDG